MVGKISTKKVSEQVEDRIEEMIRSGMFKAGEKLPSVRELCDMFEVGRSAVRDAMTTLKGRGILQVKQGEGAYVCSFDSSSLFASRLMLPNTKDIRELYQVRKMLEPGLAEIAATVRSDEDVEVLQHLLSEDGNKGEADYAFHMKIAGIAGNQILTGLMDFISAATRKAMSDVHQQIQSNEEISVRILEQHERILNSIESKQPDTARENMILHLDYVETVLVNNVLIQL
ncbi:FadR family transcriptional regulator [Rossellomorea aquimaris]|uniref:FadR/GntR family transcriptional regulator n=1 Tax=Rossellomorea aquimaris TaxID=189382 RepID=UPI001CD33ECC|nr:FadR/GntR family transcriptional regulator [Rossellomorea aquimaris]MCA1055768.1 FadR family transcriptional regulator [Rossellomorea aquimaris]